MKDPDKPKLAELCDLLRGPTVSYSRPSDHRPAFCCWDGREVGERCHLPLAAAAAFPGAGGA